MSLKILMKMVSDSCWGSVSAFIHLIAAEHPYRGYLAYPEKEPDSDRHIQLTPKFIGAGLFHSMWKSNIEGQEAEPLPAAIKCLLTYSSEVFFQWCDDLYRLKAIKTFFSPCLFVWLVGFSFVCIFMNEKISLKLYPVKTWLKREVMG